MDPQKGEMTLIEIARARGLFPDTCGQARPEAERNCGAA